MFSRSLNRKSWRVCINFYDFYERLSPNHFGSFSVKSRERRLASPQLSARHLFATIYSSSSILFREFSRNFLRSKWRPIFYRLITISDYKRCIPVSFFSLSFVSLARSSGNKTRKCFGFRDTRLELEKCTTQLRWETKRVNDSASRYESSSWSLKYCIYLYPVEGK